MQPSNLYTRCQIDVENVKHILEECPFTDFIFQIIQPLVKAAKPSVIFNTLKLIIQGNKSSVIQDIHFAFGKTILQE